MDLFKILDGTPEPPIVNLATSENNSGDYWLPVPMCDYQKELTDQVISLHYADILKYFETDDKDQLLLDSLELLYLNSQLVATHPYLLITHYLPKNLTSKDTPFNLSETSGKFKVLKDLIALVEEQKYDIAIVARSGKLLDLIEALLLGCKTNIKRHSGNHIKDPSKNKIKTDLTAHIIASDGEDGNPKQKYDLVISFDITADTDHLKKLKKNSKTPILRFVSVNSIDHCALFFRNTHHTRSKEYLVDVTAAIVVLRDRVGVLPPDLRPIFTKNLTYLKDWFKDFNNKPWPLPEMSTIRKYDSRDVERSLLTEVHFDNDKPKQNINKISYYQSKRLQNDYTSNPLKNSDFGILSINRNYNDSLTHKLIQNFNVERFKLDIQKQKFTNLKEFNENIKNYSKIDEEKMNKEIEEIQNKIKNTNINTEELISKIELIKSSIKELEEEINLKNQDESFKIEQELKAEILKQENKANQLKSEKEYMAKEIDNAKKAIEESEISIKETNSLISSNELKINSIFNDFIDLPLQNNQIDDLKSTVVTLKLSIEESLSKLNNSRARSDPRRISPSIR